MASLAEWPGFTPQLRRVVIGGLCGVIALIVLRTTAGKVEVVFQLPVLRDHLSIVPMGQLLSIFFISTVIVGWLAVTLGIWAGLRWPERLLLPANISGGTQSVRLAKNMIAVAVYLALAFVVYWSISFGIPFLVWD